MDHFLVVERNSKRQKIALENEWNTDDTTYKAFFNSVVESKDDAHITEIQATRDSSYSLGDEGVCSHIETGDLNRCEPSGDLDEEVCFGMVSLYDLLNIMLAYLRRSWE